MVSMPSIMTMFSPITCVLIVHSGHLLAKCLLPPKLSPGLSFTSSEKSTRVAVLYKFVALLPLPPSFTHLPKHRIITAIILSQFRRRISLVPIHHIALHKYTRTPRRHFFCATLPINLRNCQQLQRRFSSIHTLLQCILPSQSTIHLTASALEIQQ